MKKLILSVIFTAFFASSGAAQWLRQSTASTINLNLVKTADGTGETGATVASVSVQLMKQSDTSSNSVVSITPAASSSTHDMVHGGLGVWNLELTTTDTNTAGRLTVTWAYTGCYTLTKTWTVLPADVYDALPGGALQSGADVVALIDSTSTKLDVAVSTRASWGDLRADHTTSNTFGEGVPVAPGGIVAASIASDAFTAAKFNSDVGSEFANALLDLSSGVETNFTLRQVLRIMAAAMAGRSSGADTSAPIFRDLNNTKDRITATTNSGGRATVTLDPN